MTNNRKIQLKIKRESDLKKVAEIVINEIISNENVSGATSSVGAKIVMLRGNLGAGKTTFTKYFARELGIEENITSPTFVIQKVFDIPEQNLSKQVDNNAGFLKNIFSKFFIKNEQYKEVKIYDKFKKLYHFDMYRLHSDSELSPLNWSEIISDKNNIVVIEWPERIDRVLTLNAINIYFEFVDETTRNITIEF